jgi:hypothetical protein
MQRLSATDIPDAGSFVIACRGYFAAVGAEDYTVHNIKML